MTLNEATRVQHFLHKVIGECLDSHEFPNCKIIKGPACGGQQNVPYSVQRTNQTKLNTVTLTS